MADRMYPQGGSLVLRHPALRSPHGPSPLGPNSSPQHYHTRARRGPIPRSPHGPRPLLRHFPSQPRLLPPIGEGIELEDLSLLEHIQHSSDSYDDQRFDYDIPVSLHSVHPAYASSPRPSIDDHSGRLANIQFPELEYQGDVLPMHTLRGHRGSRHCHFGRPEIFEDLPENEIESEEGRIIEQEVRVYDPNYRLHGTAEKISQLKTTLQQPFYRFFNKDYVAIVDAVLIVTASSSMGGSIVLLNREDSHLPKITIAANVWISVAMVLTAAAIILTACVVFARSQTLEFRRRITDLEAGELRWSRYGLTQAVKRYRKIHARELDVPAVRPAGSVVRKNRQQEWNRNRLHNEHVRRVQDRYGPNAGRSGILLKSPNPNQQENVAKGPTPAQPESPAQHENHSQDESRSQHQSPGSHESRVHARDRYERPGRRQSGIPRPARRHAALEASEIVEAEILDLLNVSNEEEQFIIGELSEDEDQGREEGDKLVPYNQSRPYHHFDDTREAASSSTSLIHPSQRLDEPKVGSSSSPANVSRNRAFQRWDNMQQPAPSSTELVPYHPYQRLDEPTVGSSSSPANVSRNRAFQRLDNMQQPASSSTELVPYHPYQRLDEPTVGSSSASANMGRNRAFQRFESPQEPASSMNQIQNRPFLRFEHTQEPGSPSANLVHHHSYHRLDDPSAGSSFRAASSTAPNIFGEYGAAASSTISNTRFSNQQPPSAPPSCPLPPQPPRNYMGTVTTDDLRRLPVRDQEALFNQSRRGFSIHLQPENVEAGRTDVAFGAIAIARASNVQSRMDRHISAERQLAGGNRRGETPRQGHGHGGVDRPNTSHRRFSFDASVDENIVVPFIQEIDNGQDIGRRGYDNRSSSAPRPFFPGSEQEQEQDIGRRGYDNRSPSPYNFI